MDINRLPNTIQIWLLKCY